VAAGNNPMEIKRGIEKAVNVVVEQLKKLSKPTKDHKEIAQVGIISANGDSTIGNIIAEAMGKVGKEGVSHGRGGEGPRDHARGGRKACSSTRLPLALLRL